MNAQDAVERHFWSHVSRGDRCWTWTGRTAATGYGVVSFGPPGVRHTLAHRLSWLIAYGPIPDGLHVLHHCDNRPCVRPDHLFLGTRADNCRDRYRKGRTASGDRNGARTRPERNTFVRNGGSGMAGEGHARAKLTDKQVALLITKVTAGLITRAQAARLFGVSKTHVARLLAGRRRPTRSPAGKDRGP